MTKLVVFLGNPGSEYRLTRHNTAWLMADKYIKQTGWQEKFHGLFGKTGNTVYLKPMTYMNLSGIAVQEATKFFGIKPEHVLAVHDDIETDFGKIKLQLGGGMGGHNGLKSIKTHLNTDAFYRLRIGIGRPELMEVASWVTGRFSPEQESKLSDIFEQAYGKMVNWLKENE